MALSMRACPRSTKGYHFGVIEMPTFVSVDLIQNMALDCGLRYPGCRERPTGGRFAPCQMVGRRLEKIRDLLVHVGGGEAGRRRVRFSVDLTLRMSARLRDTRHENRVLSRPRLM
jgi:hypothetical protein